MTCWHNINMIEEIWESHEYEDGLDQSWQPEEEKGKSLPRLNVEDTFTITAGSFGSHLLRPIQTSITGLGGGTLGRSGKAIAWNWSRPVFMEINYEVILDEDPAKLFISFTQKKFTSSQEIPIELLSTALGSKPYLTCFCGNKGKLYLRPDCHAFLCRKCANLTYQIKEMDPRWSINSIGYYINRSHKIDFLASKHQRIVYKGRPTRRTVSIMKLAAKWRSNPKLTERVMAACEPHGKFKP